MDSIDRQPLEIADSLLQQLHAYWTTIRGACRMPSRAQVDPADMRFILGQVMMIDVTDRPAGFKVRLQGTELAWCLGSDLTGKTLEGLRSTGLRALLRECFAQSVITLAPVHQTSRQNHDGVPRLYSVLVLPLSADDRHVDKLLVGVRCFETG
jgi:hypothetical protein